MERRERLWFAAGFAVPVAIFAVYAATLANAPFYGRGARSLSTGIPLLDGALLTLVFGYFAGKAAVAIRAAYLGRRSRSSIVDRG